MTSSLNRHHRWTHPCCDLSANGKPTGYRPKLVGLYKDALQFTGLSVTESAIQMDSGLLDEPTLELVLSYIYLGFTHIEK